MTQFSGTTPRWDKWKCSGMSFSFPQWTTFWPAIHQPLPGVLGPETELCSHYRWRNWGSESLNILPRSIASWKRAWREGEFPDWHMQFLWYPLKSAVCPGSSGHFPVRRSPHSPSYTGPLDPFISTCFWKNLASGPPFPATPSPFSAEIFPAFSL